MEEDKHKQMPSDQSSKGSITSRKDVVVGSLDITILKKHFVHAAVTISQQLILKDIRRPAINEASGIRSLIGPKAITISP